MSAKTHRVDMVLFDLTPRILSVVKKQALGPRMLRVTVAGDDLAGFKSASPADHVKLCFPAPDAEQPIMPQIGERGLIPIPADQPQPTFRDYTVRAFRPESNELDIDFVIHGDGPAVRWSTEAEPGRLVGVLGPRGSRVVDSTFDWYLLGGDATALPAIGRWIEESRAGAYIQAFIAVTDRDDEQTFSSAADLDVTWIHHGAQDPAESDLLLRAVQQRTRLNGDGYAWFAGEAGMLKPIRKHLRTEFADHPEWFDVDGYWRRGVANLDHHATVDDDDE